MSKITKIALLSVSLLLITFTVAGSLGVQAGSSGDGAYRQIEVYTEVLNKVHTDYVEEPNLPHVTDGALHGLLESLDANSSFLNPAEYKKYKTLKDQKAAVGAAVSKRFGYAAVISVIPGGPADKAGVENGDIIEAIEGKSTREMSLAEVNGALGGAQGSNVNISVVRPRKAMPVKITITRDLVKEPAVTDKMLENQTGYILVGDLTKGRAQEVAAKIKDLQKQGAKKLIVDLRGSGMGDEQEGISTANLFLNHGTITYVQGQKYPKQTFTADAKNAVTTLPLVVLVNRSTAGPSEVIASAVLDNARGDVLGDKTFGSGSIQNVIEMGDGSALVLSVAKYYTPGGKAIQDTAITPNISVADSNDDFASPDDDGVDDTTKTPEKKEAKPKSDEQLRRAIEVLKNKEQKAA